LPCGHGLICDECGETSEDGEGWTAVLALMLLDGYEYKVKGPEGGRGLLPEVLVARVR
jgi:hypothetical protein